MIQSGAVGRYTDKCGVVDSEAGTPNGEGVETFYIVSLDEASWVVLERGELSVAILGDKFGDV